MPLCYKENLGESGVWGIWEIQECEDWFFRQWQLSPQEDRHFSGLKNVKRLEFLGSRHLVHLLTGFENRVPLLKESSGKPLFDRKDNMYVSLSHSHGYAAAILSNNIQLGIDIQLIVPQIQKVANRVFNDKELSFISNGKELHMLHIFWGIKEAVFKAFGAGGIDYREHIHIQPFEYREDSGEFTAHLIKENLLFPYRGTYHLFPVGYISIYLFGEKPVDINH
jgi:phosphopantetheinyl transferase